MSAVNLEGLKQVRTKQAALRDQFKDGLRRISSCALYALFLFCSTFALILGAAPAGNLEELQKHLQEHVSQAKFDAAIWGVKIVSLDSGKTIFEHNPQKLFSPASNSKLYTVALALDRFGTDYRIKTSLYTKAKTNHWGTLKGDLVVYGRGDPGINTRLNGDDIFKALEPLVRAVTNAGIRKISGDLVGDETFFRGPPFGSGWAWDDLENYYGAEISSLTINDNTLQLRVRPGDRLGAPCRLSLTPATGYLFISNKTETVEKGGRRAIHSYRPLTENVLYVWGQMPLEGQTFTDDVTLHDPGGLFLRFFKEALARHGIKVRGKLRAVTAEDPETNPADYTEMREIGFIESMPMGDIAREVMKPSQNLYTDLLLASVGEKARGDDQRQTSEDLGIHELSRFMKEVGIAANDVLFEEGSGLSRNNLTTPNATIALLQYMNRHACSTAYRDALPIAGVDGTLRNRMKGTAAANNVRAKTGTLRWANALSGFVTTAGGGHWAFSIMLNRYHSLPGESPGRAEVDAIAVMLADYAGNE
jgi:D-alanyl-D-alanine carboxypeptidase/D-alanyl-D-alanine-endopeptidase (penicillin-binding protein 4)